MNYKSWAYKHESTLADYRVVELNATSRTGSKVLHNCSYTIILPVIKTYNLMHNKIMQNIFY